MSQRISLATPDPQFLEILSTLPKDAPQVTGISQVRQGFVDGAIKPQQESLRPHLPPAYTVRDTQVQVDGGEILVRALIPTPHGESGDQFPVLVWYHASGWHLASIDLDDFTMRIACVELQVVIVLVAYRLAPENPFPTSVNDSYTALKWVVENAPSLSVSLEKGFIVGGASAGGNLAAVSVNQARDDPFFNEHPITGQLLDYPTTIHPHAVSERWKGELSSLIAPETNIPGIFNNTDLVGIYDDYKVPDPSDLRVSPLLLPSHKGLPRTFMQSCGLDPLRDEGLAYERLLREAGVETKLIIYPGLPHSFHHFFLTIDASKRFEEDFKEGLKWLLRRV
ncbi:uncharacterized protein STEHIDRAFT_151510 [Stereum hirsutum FP-91666 SS1]|uniref:uncharacterized protein n=1 Tax=Stereum hirsutum (strain FP-91666) TaxID=721885 RepID=UPI000440AA96|nr:uncharacterized protein STEHIDRAFT_151510 [Stereum hirsutum FP-91666 SS1]EIM92168.1 hypothetical protein STEHIDRAFT_151510 [Stereum hirsutum FP-91666 SS1]